MSQRQANKLVGKKRSKGGKKDLNKEKQSKNKEAEEIQEDQ
jgi:hypothetical protein|tara:strand:+ start:2323 stop:2445 length:123 start_codon:yes stop_codon:yes gene_type:complete